MEVSIINALFFCNFYLQCIYTNDIILISLSLVTAFTKTAELLGLPKPCSVQNAYNLLVRNDFENGMLEACSQINNNLSVLAYSPLAGGALTGKYLDPKKVHPNARMRKFVGFMHR